MLEAVGEIFPDAKYQRCTVHFYRNVFSVVPKSKLKIVAKMLKAIHAQESKKASREKAKAVVAELRAMKLKEAAKKVEDGIEETLTYEFATKRYRSNCINWGIVPYTIEAGTPFDLDPGDFVLVPDIREAILSGKEQAVARVVSAKGVGELTLHFANLTPDERQILADGCLMNYYAARQA